MWICYCLEWGGLLGGLLLWFLWSLLVDGVKGVVVVGGRRLGVEISVSGCVFVDVNVGGS